MYPTCVSSKLCEFTYYSLLSLLLLLFIYYLLLTKANLAHLLFKLDHDRLTGGRHGGTNLSETGEKNLYTQAGKM